ncbi:MAG: DUF2889 domain-containing protein [Magnetovibrionaceae bacterium]
MPLSKPKARSLIHTRAIDLKGYHRDDGLWDIEACLVDTKTYSFANTDRGGLSAGEPIHHMLVRITVDDEMTILGAETSTEAAPFFTCADINPTFSDLTGLQIKSGWRRAVLMKFGGLRGCTHIVDLLCGPIAQCAHQTVSAARARRHGHTTEGHTTEGHTTEGHTTEGQTTEKDATGAEERTRPAMIDTCHALSADGPVVEREWPEFFEK